MKSKRTAGSCLVALALVLVGCSEDGAAKAGPSDDSPQSPGQNSGGSSANNGSGGGSPSNNGDGNGAQGGAGGGSSGGIGAGTNSASPGSVSSESSSPGDDAGAPAPISDVVANPFVDPAHDPFSTFAADVDTASFDTFLQYVLGGSLPLEKTVRVEDFVNFFAYDYPDPAADGEHPFTIDLKAAAHPSARGTQLLRVGIQGKRAPEQAKKPANLVFLVDVSGSMAGPDKLPLVKVLLKNTLGVLEDTDKVSIVTYAGYTQVALEPTPVAKHVAIEDIIDGLGAGGGTNGSGGLQLAYEQAAAAKIEGGINHVILCTDGDFNLGISQPKELGDFISKKRDTGITMTAIGFGRVRSGDGLMEQLSNRGDGIYGVVYDEDQAIKYANERLLSTLLRIAKDMKIQVEFNPELVEAYRLIGYENRAIADEDFRDDLVDAGDIGAGHRVTALYELVPKGGAVPMPAGAAAVETGAPVAGAREIQSEELVRVKVRYKAPDAGSTDPAAEVIGALPPTEVLSDASSDQDFAWAAAIANLAELLRKSPYASLHELDRLGAVIEAQAKRDGDRAALAGLIAKTSQLLRARN